MKTDSKLKKLCDAMMRPELFPLDIKVVLTDKQIEIEMEDRVRIDQITAAERQKELNDMFPERINGSLYEPQEQKETFDF